MNKIYIEYPKLSDQPNACNGKLIVDDHGASCGYFYAAYNGTTDKKLKLRAVKDSQSSTYDLNQDGEFELFPLNNGSGNYQVLLFENVIGNRYADAGCVNITVNLINENAALLIPNQYIMYNENSEVVRVANEICNCKKEDEAFESICDYIKKNFVYDYIKAFNRKKYGQFPKVDEVVKSHKGVCDDLAAVVVAMCRSQGIQSKLVIGHTQSAGGSPQCHAWTVSIVDGKEILFDPTLAITYSKTPKYIAERFY